MGPKITINDPHFTDLFTGALANGSEHKQISIIPAAKMRPDDAPIILVSYKTYEAIHRSLQNMMKYTGDSDAK